MVVVGCGCMENTHADELTKTSLQLREFWADAYRQEQTLSLLAIRFDTQLLPKKPQPKKPHSYPDNHCTKSPKFLGKHRQPSGQLVVGRTTENTGLRGIVETLVQGFFDTPIAQLSQSHLRYLVQLSQGLYVGLEVVVVVGVFGIEGR
jgi:hypothetical protein